jgi:uncharacterized protein (DUF58 family)
VSAQLREPLDPGVVARLGSLEFIAREIVMGFLKGLHFSAGKGSSIEFHSYRPYVPGDEVRRLDWRTFGKTDRFYLKEYHDETNLRVTLVLDASASMGFGSAGLTKLRYASCLAAALGFLFHSQRDAVGLAVVDSRVRQLVPPKATARHLSGLFALLEGAEARGPTRLAGAIHSLAERLPRGGAVVVLSDFLDDPRAVITSLEHLRHREAEVLAFHLLDPAEESFPFQRWTIFRDSEDPTVAVRLDARQVRGLYEENLAAHLANLRQGCRAAGIDYALVRTAEPFAEALARCLEARARRRR